MLLRELAKRIGSISSETAPAAAVDTAKLAILDTIGVTLAGAGSQAATITAETVCAGGGEGRSLLFGSNRRTDMLNAALVNGTAAHALDFDDCSNMMGGHPSAPVVPALWALSDGRDVAGPDFLSAYIAGVETETRLGRAVNVHHYEKGWHPSATLGVFGSAAACARLLELGEEQTAAALGLAVSMASGVKANFGTMTKPFHIGHAARNGLMAALLASKGMTANEDALQHRQGFLAVYNGDGNFRVDALLEHWADPLDLVDPGIGFKRHPCCASTHSPIDAMLSLLEDRKILPEDVVRIDCRIHPRRIGHVDRADPQTGLQAKFSLQYVLARALLDGFVSLDHFSDGAVRDPASRDLMRRITVGPDPDAVMATNEHFYAKLVVELMSGERLTAFVDRAVGRDHDHPMPADILQAKFLDCAGQALRRENVLETRDLLGRLETLERVGVVSDILADGALRGTGPMTSRLSV